MRIRTIKPEFFTHEGIFEAEQESKLPLRLAFIGLWCAADREGRFKWEPRRLGVSILPYDSIDFSRVLDALCTRGFIVKYRVDDGVFGAIPSFKRHQVINVRESASKIPEMANSQNIESEPSRVLDACLTRDVHAQGEGKGREGNKEGKGKEQGAAVAAVVLPLPFESPAFADAWADWLTYRKERKLTPYKPTALKAQLATLAEWGEVASIHSIRESIRQNWQGLFEPKQQITKTAPAGTPVQPIAKPRIPDNLREDL